MIDFNFKQKLQGLPKSDMTGVYGEIQDDNAVYGVITAYAQGVTSSMRTDWQDGTERTFEWKIAKPVRSTHYIKISVPCFIASISPKDYFNEPSEAVFNLIMGLPTITTRGCKYTNFGLVAP